MIIVRRPYGRCNSVCDHSSVFLNVSSADLRVITNGSTSSGRRGVQCSANTPMAQQGRGKDRGKRQRRLKWRKILKSRKTRCWAASNIKKEKQTVRETVGGTDGSTSTVALDGSDGTYPPYVFPMILRVVYVSSTKQKKKDDSSDIRLLS